MLAGVSRMRSQPSQSVTGFSHFPAWDLPLPVPLLLTCCSVGGYIRLFNEDGRYVLGAAGRAAGLALVSARVTCVHGMHYLQCRIRIYNQAESVCHYSLL